MLWVNALGEVRRAGRGPAWLCTVLVLSVVCICLLAGACGQSSDGARELENAGDWTVALEVYQRALAEDPDDITALSGAAVALMVLGRYDEALPLQERVTAADPEDAQTRVELGFNYLSHQNRPSDAVRVLTEAVELENTAKNLTFLSQAQRAAGDIQGAESSLKSAIEADEGYGYAYSQLAALLRDEGRNDEAAQLIEDARMHGVDVTEQR